MDEIIAQVLIAWGAAPWAAAPGRLLARPQLPCHDASGELPGAGEVPGKNVRLNSQLYLLRTGLYMLETPGSRAVATPEVKFGRQCPFSVIFTGKRVSDGNHYHHKSIFNTAEEVVAAGHTLRQLT